MEKKFNIETQIECGSLTAHVSVPVVVKNKTITFEEKQFYQKSYKIFGSLYL